jgi:threonyl-tRNA synthetase
MMKTPVRYSGIRTDGRCTLRCRIICVTRSSKDGYHGSEYSCNHAAFSVGTSGHWGHYQKNMFITESEKRMFAIKPMNCPGALEIFKTRTRSYKDLPMRLAEFGHCVRNEPSGTLHGTMRVRGFVQDDAHILCTDEQISSEVAKFCRLLKDVYKDFGFDKNLLVKFSTMPDDHVGDLATWQHAEAALADACQSGRT